MGWNYAMQWLTVFPFELVAAGLTVRYWNDQLSGAIFITVFWVAIVFINLAGVRGYGEAEFVFSIIKVTAVIGFIILGIVIDAGGGPNGHTYGTEYWHNPGSFNNVPSLLLRLSLLLERNSLVLLPRKPYFPQYLSMLIVGKPKKDPPTSNQTSHLAYHHFLHGLPHHHRLPSPLHRAPSPKLRLLHRHQSLSLCHCGAKRGDQSRSLDHECGDPHFRLVRWKLLHLRRDADFAGTGGKRPGTQDFHVH